MLSPLYKEIMLGDNNTAYLADYIINGIAKSTDEELWRLLEGLLLAAKLQEGLRQSILENADNGRVEFFIRMMKVVLDHDPVRYSSVIRALNVWMGLGETFEDRRVAAKLLSLGYSYLTDPKALAAGAESADVTELYTALWAASVREMADAITLIEKLLRGEKYRKLTALYFLLQTENDILQSFSAARLLGETDLDVLSLVMRNFLPSGTGWHRTTESFRSECRSYRILSDGPVRGRQFRAIINMIPLLPANGYRAKGKPFPWYDLSLTRRDLFERLLIIAGYDFDPEKTERLIGLIPGSDPGSRAFFIRFFLEEPKDANSRAFVFAALNDKSISVRSQALKTILGFSQKSAAASVAPVTAEEEKTVTGLLALKTGDLRQNALKILLSLDGERPLMTAKVLLSDRDANKRLGGLDMLTQLVKAEKLSRTEVAWLCALMPEVSDKERVLVDSLGTAGDEKKYNRANGFGLYDPAYIPDFPFPKEDKKYGLDNIFGFSPERIKTIFGRCVKKHDLPQTKP
jgi:hypothetical protein